MYHSLITHNNITIHVTNKKITLHYRERTDSVDSNGCPVTSALLRHQLKPSPCLSEQSTLLFFTVVMTITDFHKMYHISQ